MDAGTLAGVIPPPRDTIATCAQMTHRLVVQLRFNPLHEVQDVGWGAALNRLLHLHAVRPAVLVFGPRVHGGARLGGARLGEEAVQHADGVEEVNSVHSQPVASGPRQRPSARPAPTGSDPTRAHHAFRSAPGGSWTCGGRELSGTGPGNRETPPSALDGAPLRAGCRCRWCCLCAASGSSTGPSPCAAGTCWLVTTVARQWQPRHRHRERGRKGVRTDPATEARPWRWMPRELHGASAPRGPRAKASDRDPTLRLRSEPVHLTAFTECHPTIQVMR